jgi:hypothetical protein
MPYIPPERRQILHEVDALAAMVKVSPSIKKSDLTYAITKLIVAYVKVKGKSYDILADVDAILFTTLLEFHERVTNPYERKKQIMNDPNNDIYGEILD